MRLATLSDIHGNLIALEAVLADLEAQGGADHTWILGDLALGGTHPSQAIQRVKAIVDAADQAGKKHTIRLVRGNTDRSLLDGSRTKYPHADSAESFDKMRQLVSTMNDVTTWCINQLTFEDYEFLKQLRGECDLHAEGYGWVIGYHGTPGDDEGFLLPTTSEEEAADILSDREGRLGIGAHIHTQFDRHLAYNHWRVVNIGSVGMSFTNAGYAQYAIFTFENGEVSVDLRNVPYDVDAAVAQISAVDHPAPRWLEKLLRHGNA